MGMHDLLGPAPQRATLTYLGPSCGPNRIPRWPRGPFMVPPRPPRRARGLLAPIGQQGLDHRHQPETVGIEAVVVYRECLTPGERFQFRRKVSAIGHNRTVDQDR